jgi:hypothetical protein
MQTPDKVGGRKEGGVFFFWLSQFCEVTKLANHGQEDLAELGYQAGMKVKFQKNPSHFGLNARTPIEKNLTFFSKENSKSGN